jgi:hypothetical protein
MPLLVPVEDIPQTDPVDFDKPPQSADPVPSIKFFQTVQCLPVFCQYRREIIDPPSGKRAFVNVGYQAVFPGAIRTDIPHETPRGV